MKINNLKINAYGNIENKNIELEQGINIIHGKNESGKSTLLNYIISSFYGISKNKDGRLLSDYEKYKPWNSSEFSGRIEYELDSGERLEIFRDFNKKNPKIYNDKLEDITNQFEIDKRDGSKFFMEQTGVDKQMYLSTVVSVQEEVRLNDKDQNILIQKIANLAGTGDDNVSYKKALTKLQDKIRDEIGTSKTSQKPINILEKEINDIENKIIDITPYKNRKYEIDNEKEEIEDNIKQLELKKKILTEIQELTENGDIQNKEIEIKEKNKKENLFRLSELKNKEQDLHKDAEEIKQLIKNATDNLEDKRKEQEDIDINLATMKNQKIEENFSKEKNKNIILLLVGIICMILGGIMTIVLKKYIFTGILVEVALINIVFYVNNTKKQSRHKTEKINKAKEEVNVKINELEEQRNKLLEMINKTSKKLEEYKKDEQEVNSQISMIKGQNILLVRNNEQIDNELETIRKHMIDKKSIIKDEITNKYKEQFSNIDELIQEEEYKSYIGELEEKINNDKIKVKGLEIENNTIVPQLDEIVILEEKLEADKERLSELRKQESIINIAIENLTEAYEEMKNTITPKFTSSLSSSINKISNSKYEKVTINDENGMIVENNRGEYIEAAKLSTGTIDQLYLALRLSMIDDLSKEKLPIILDESFAYFDNTRLENILKYMSEELENHQIIVFTCTNREKEILDVLKIKYNMVEI